MYSRSFWAVVGLALLVAVSNLAGQVTQSTILGSVTDSTGSAVPGATVTVQNEGTNVERTMQTDEAGDYRIAGLEVGSYAVRVTAPGFKGFQQTEIPLSSNQIKRVDVSLEVGEITTVVTVEGGASMVETETVTLSNIKTSRDYTQLPLSIFGRGWANVTNVTAGVQSTSGFEVNGARDTANNFTSDGISVNDIISSRNTANGFSGEIESLAEVKIMTANNSAEHPQVAQFAAVTKSGSNELHGSAYWGNFNSAFSARQWQDSGEPAFTNHNMFAVTNGGPVYIPGVYDGRNKTFYFFSYGGARYRVGGRQFVNIPTPAIRSGDFSAFLAPNLPEDARIQLIDPLNGQPFPNNQIPQDRFSGVALALQDLLYPDPNLSGSGLYGLEQNYTADPGGAYDSDVFSIRVDQRVSDKNNLFVRVGLTVHNSDTYPAALNNGYGEGAWIGRHPGRSVVVSDTHTFSPNLVNELKLGFSRDFGQWTDPNSGQLDVVEALGLQGIPNPDNDPALADMPGFDFGGLVDFHGTTTWATGNFQAQNTYQLIDNVSWYRGRHSLKMGFDLRHLQINDQSVPQSIRGEFTFDDRLSGLSYANFLLGYPSSATLSLPRPNAYPRSWMLGGYIQDDFKINRRATLNIGLRYERQAPWTEKYDRMFTFDRDTASLVTAGSTIPSDLVPEVAETLPIITATEAGFPERSLFEADNNNFSPRIGLAIRPFGDASTVVRMGYGFYMQMWPGLLALRATGGPWQSTRSFFIEGDDQPTIRFPNPFVTTSEFSGIQSVGGLNPNFPNERTQQWNFSIGRQLWGAAIDVGYIGTAVKNIPLTEDLNLPLPSTDPFDAADRPYPLFNSVDVTTSGGSSIYHGLTIQADRKVAGGLSFNANYTWAKALTDVDLRTFSTAIQQNQYQRSLERADDPNIRRQQLRFSYVYELPFGRGRPFASNLGAAANAIIGGWQVSGITTMYTGARLSPTFSGTDPAGTNQFSGRPDRVGDGNLDSGDMRDLIRARQPILDINAFIRPESNRGFYGNSARYILTGPGSANWNFVVAKNFPLQDERARLQFRWEMFNAFNRPNFSNPNTNINSGAFGLVTQAGAARSMLFGLRLDY